MTDFSLISEGSPIPAVDVRDVRSVWSLIAQTPAPNSGSTGIAASLIAQECSPGADVVAVFLRAALINILLQQDVLEEWRDGVNLRDAVLWNAATFPFPDGLNVDPERFLSRLKEYR